MAIAVGDGHLDLALLQPVFNQTEYVGLVPKHIGSVGDLTFAAGFALTAVIYLTWRLVADRTARAALAVGARAHQV